MKTRSYEQKSNKTLKKKILPYVYLSPALITIFFLTLIPIIYTFYISFTNYSINHLSDFKFIGIENYKTILSGPLKTIFFPVLGWTIVFALISTLGSFFVGLILAMVLGDPNMKESKVYKGLLIIPWAIPATIAIITWQGLLNPTYGGINVLLKTLHIINENIPWLTSPFWARTGLIIVNIWLAFPYMMNVCIGALSAIPDSYYEAADIDGASWISKFIKITLPSLAYSTFPLIISSFAVNFNNFNIAYLITGGNPVRLNSAFAGYTDVLVSATYKLAMQQNRYDLGAALGVVIFIIVGGISFVNMKLSGSFEEVD